MVGVHNADYVVVGNCSWVQLSQLPPWKFFVLDTYPESSFCGSAKKPLKIEHIYGESRAYLLSKKQKLDKEYGINFYFISAHHVKAVNLDMVGGYKLKINRS